MVQGLIWTDGVSMSYHLIAIFNFFFSVFYHPNANQDVQMPIFGSCEIFFDRGFFFFLFSFFSVPKSLQVQVMKLPKLHP